MKTLLIILIIILLLPAIYAVEFNMKDNYAQSETLIAKLSGNFAEPVLRENVAFYRQRTFGEGFIRIPVNVYDITKIQGDYYIFAELPSTANNYQIRIEDTRYYQGVQQIEDDIIKNFIISNQTVPFNINPGFINANKDFTIGIQNFADSEISVSTVAATLSGSTSSLSFPASMNIKSGQSKKLEFKTANIQESSFKIITLTSQGLNYEVPVFVVGNKSLPENKTQFRFDPDFLEIVMATESETTRIIYLDNTGTEKIEDLEISISKFLQPFATISIAKIEQLQPNSSAKIEVTFFSALDELIFDGSIKAESSDFIAYSDVSFSVVSNYVPLPEEVIIIDPRNGTAGLESCLALDGKLCLESESCSGEEITSLEGSCCLSDCKEKTVGSTGKIIGWTIVIVVVLLLIWFFAKKYKSAKRPFDLLERGERGNRRRKIKEED